MECSTAQCAIGCHGVFEWSHRVAVCCRVSLTCARHRGGPTAAAAAAGLPARLLMRRLIVFFVSARQEWYGQWLTGIFLDETAHVADDLNDGDRAMCARYRGFRFHTNVCFGESALVSTSGVSTDCRCSCRGNNGAIAAPDSQRKDLEFGPGSRGKRTRMPDGFHVAGSKRVTQRDPCTFPTIGRSAPCRQ